MAQWAMWVKSSFRPMSDALRCLNALRVQTLNGATKSSGLRHGERHRQEAVRLERDGLLKVVRRPSFTVKLVAFPVYLYAHMYQPSASVVTVAFGVPVAVVPWKI